MNNSGVYKDNFSIYAPKANLKMYPIEWIQERMCFYAHSFLYPNFMASKSPNYQKYIADITNCSNFFYVR